MSADEGGGGIVSSGSSSGDRGQKRTTEVVETALALYRQGGEGGISPEVARNLRPEHIDKALDHAENSHKRLGEDRRDSRRFIFYAFLAGIGLVVSVVALLVFTGNSQILADNMDVVLGFAAGAGGGYGLGRRTS